MSNKSFTLYIVSIALSISANHVDYMNIAYDHHDDLNNNAITKAICLTPLSVATYVSQNGLPIQHLGDTIFLRFDSTNLTSLNGTQTINLTNATQADFINNCIVGSTLDLNFPSDPFVGLPSLSSILLNQNSIESLPSTFLSSVPYLAYLTLSANKLSSLPTGFFDNTPDIRFLGLANNLFTSTTTITIAQLPALQTLNLNGNQIATISDTYFQNNTDLTQISLSKNKLSLWPSDALNNVLYLQKIDLSYNLLTNFTPTYLANSCVVILTGNPILPATQAAIIAAYPEAIFVF